MVNRMGKQGVACQKVTVHAFCTRHLSRVRCSSHRGLQGDSSLTSTLNTWCDRQAEAKAHMGGLQLFWADTCSQIDLLRSRTATQTFSCRELQNREVIWGSDLRRGVMSAGMPKLMIFLSSWQGCKRKLPGWDSVVSERVWSLVSCCGRDRPGVLSWSPVRGGR